MKDLPLHADTTVSDLTRSIPGAARVFERHGIDFCCGGKRALREACSAVGVPVEEVVRELGESRSDPADVPVPEGLTGLIGHVLATHHAFEREELVRLCALSEKVARVHGGRRPELCEVAALCDELREDLEPHMLKEEQVLFPYLIELDAGRAPGARFGSVANPIRMMSREHDRVGELLRKLSAVSGGYALPADACNSYRALYEGLAGLQADIHRHVQLENDRLFPQALALEAVRAGRTPAH